jgi:hypothetical protein
MKVFIISIGEYSDAHTVGVFSSKEKAKEFKEKIGGEKVCYTEEYELDEIKMVNNLLTFYVDKIYFEDASIYENCYWEEGRYFDKIIETKINITEGKDYKQKYRKFSGIVLAKNKQHALKILNEFSSSYNAMTPFIWSKEVICYDCQKK